jgi:hypothetical protein
MIYFYKLILKETDFNEEQNTEEEWEREMENIQVQLYINQYSNKPKAKKYPTETISKPNCIIVSFFLLLHKRLVIEIIVSF